MAGYGKYAGKSEDERRKMFEEECAKHPLADQLEELKKIEGFPIGKDEDIIALSDTPYYTACPPIPISMSSSRPSGHPMIPRPMTMSGHRL
ncbi:hypothetical protein [Methanogenium cariaci]|uniref:hypothetical protein n=1 Tax=Methanogenium cariaci TaxID=2197 RepID=UPI000ABDA338|nr:hypothetical protein [Methanogenium cariaci]